MPKIDSYLAEILSVPKEQIAECGAEYAEKEVKKGTVLLSQGEVCRHTFFVEKGLLRLYSTDSAGREHIVQFAPENWLISDRSSLYFNEKSNYFIDCIEDSHIIMLQQNFFTNLAKKFPDSLANNDLLLQRHIRNLQKRVNSLLADSAEQRYLEFIKMYPDLLLRVPQWMVASYLGITPESLSRVRKELANRNFVVKE